MPRRSHPDYCASLRHEWTPENIEESAHGRRCRPCHSGTDYYFTRGPNLPQEAAMHATPQPTTGYCSCYCHLGAAHVGQKCECIGGEGFE